MRIAGIRSTVQPLTHTFAHLEKRHFFLCNLNAGSGTRITTCPRFALANRKGTKTTQLNTVAAFKCTAYFIKNSGYKTLDITMIERRVFCRQSGD